MHANLKIGYVPYSDDLSQPADRRRFPHFAKRKNIRYEIADPQIKYDLVILTAPGNLGRWLRYKRKNPDVIFIFEMVDSLIFSPDSISKFFKGTGRFLLRKDSLLYFNYRKLIIKWIQIADLVLCSSTQIKSYILQWNRNVIVSLDYLEDEYKNLKKDFSINGKMKLVWEGQGSVLPHLLHFKNLFKEINSFCELHVITSAKYSLLGGLDKRDTSNLLNKLPIKTILHKWDIHNKDLILSECDCGIIPLDRKNLFAWHKPANKLISFWFTGLPTIVSDIPAYVEVMNNSNCKFQCSTIEEWVSKIKWIRDLSKEEREEVSMKSFQFVYENYSNQALDLTWGNIFEKLF